MEIKIGQITKASQKLAENRKLSKDGYLNIRHLTSFDGVNGPALNLQRPMFWYKGEGDLCPAIIISSNPLQLKKEIKPWEDIISPLDMKVLYYGDNKTPGQDPSITPKRTPQTGNSKMLSQLPYFFGKNRELRGMAPPIIVFQHCKVNGSTKGYRKFIGLGLLVNYELVEQQTSKGEVFSNFLYHIDLIELKNDTFNWQWIRDRRNPSFDLNRKNLLRTRKLEELDT